ncbi:nuclear pore assembly and biogenesis-domain-containing protein [Aspergillus cavernicola]|uniref:Nuclear pore assembly and biogenesis-domain-containing protein n=1 Tax=Aspergillus cavernicola TaxID=176166 RepID=A0ABR4IWY1_9EURO
MENLPEYIQSLLQHPTIQQLASSPIASNLANLHATYLNPSVAHIRESYLDPSLSHLRSTYLDPYVVQPLAHLLASMPDLASVLVLVFILFVSFKVLDYTRRAVMFWVWLTMRLAWWATIISLGLYMYQAGWGKVARDLGFLFNFLVGLLETFGHRLEDSSRERDSASQDYWRKT